MNFPKRKQQSVRKFFGSSGTKNFEAEEGTSDYLNPEDEGTLQEIAEGVGSGLLATTRYSRNCYNCY